MTVPKKYNNVIFKFVCAIDDPVDLPGIVLVRDAEMVLEVVEPDDPRPYVVVGKAREGFFEGKHQGLPGDVAVRAKWVRLDDRYIGTWIQDGVESLFTFMVPEE